MQETIGMTIDSGATEKSQTSLFIPENTAQQRTLWGCVSFSDIERFFIGHIKICRRTYFVGADKIIRLFLD